MKNYIRAFALWLLGIRILWSLVTIRMMGWDWDEVLMLAMGFAGVAYIIVDLKRERRLDQFAIAICEDISMLKQVLGNGHPYPLNERVARLEAILPEDIEARLCGLENDEDLSALEKRVAAMETQFEQVEVLEKVAAIEARLDHKPVTQTRHRGKFASATALQEEIETLRAKIVVLEAARDSAK